MILSPVQSGFRTLNAGPSQTRFTGGRSGQGPQTLDFLEQWGFEATVSDADEVFLVLQEDRRASRWTPMVYSASTGRWNAQLSLRPGRRKACVYVQRGASLLQCGSSGLRLLRPSNAGGGVQIELASLKWQA